MWLKGRLLIKLDMAANVLRGFCQRIRRLSLTKIILVALQTLVVKLEYCGVIKGQKRLLGASVDGGSAEIHDAG